MIDRELVSIPIQVPEAMETTSGIARHFPHVFGCLYEESREKPTTALLFCHPNTNFMEHYALRPFAAQGYACLGFTTRYLNNDSALIMEETVLDVAEAVRYLRERYRNVVLVGNSGGGPLMSMYQSQAEGPSITITPAGDLPDLTKADLPTADGLILLAAHTGRAQVLTDNMDASVVDERDPDSRDPALDMFDRANGPPYSEEFVRRYRAAQEARNLRITDWVRDTLIQRNAGGTRSNLAFTVYRTMADLRFTDLSVDPSDREPGCMWGDAEQNNRHTALGHARFSSLRSWLSQWGLTTTNGDALQHLPRSSAPVLVIDYTGDQGAFPSYADALFAAATVEDKELRRIKEASHYLIGQETQLKEMVETVSGWLEDRGM